MRNRATTLFAAAALACLIPAAALSQPLASYSQDFEFLIQTDPDALANDGWLVFGNVYEPDGVTYLYGYGAFPAPNDGAGFCQIDLGQGGAEQGIQQLVVFSDYENVDHAVGNIIEANTFQEQIIGSENVGETWIFEYQAKLGNIELNSTAAAFIKILEPAPSFALVDLIPLDMTSIPATWGGYSLSVTIDPSWVGYILQFGFLNRATNYEGSGIYYDNVNFRLNPTATLPGRELLGAELDQNYPNPFNPSTRIEFTLDRPGPVEIAVFDLSGRRVATLENRELGIGDHVVTWNGRTDSGAPVASGRYSYVLKTASGQVSRSMTLVK